MTVAGDAAADRVIEQDSDARAHREDFGSSDDVKAILHNIALLIADADRRHGDALGEMQARLEQLGSDARSVRHRVPDTYMTAFERIEDGLSLLADKLARAEADRAEMRASAASVATSQTTEQVVDAPVAPASAAPVAITVAPLALASAAEPVESRAAAPSAVTAIDPFEVTDAAGHRDPDEPWDREQAEALTRVYEADALGISHAAMQAVTGSSPGVVAPAMAALSLAGSIMPERAPPAAAFAVQPPAMPPAEQHPEIEREWLEAKFAEIAERVELSLAEMRPDSAFAGLESRFDQMESRFSTALEEVANRTDPEGLRVLESQIVELAQHVEEAQAQLQRLGSIEAQLNAVVEQLSDQRFAELLDQSTQHGQPDLHGLALAAAEEVAARMAAIQPAPAAEDKQGAVEAEAQRIGELRDLLHSFMMERREGEENTASMLDTMQHAMIRLLDRVEAIELSQSGAAAPAHAETVHPVALAAAAPVDAAIQAAPVAPAPSLPVQNRVLPEEPQPAAHLPPPVPQPSAPHPAAEAAPGAIGGDGPMTLEQLRAAARRAQQAAAQAAEAETAAKSASKGSAKGAAKAAAKATKPARTDGGGASNTKRHLLVGALALLVLVPAALMLLPKKSSQPAKGGNIIIETPTERGPVNPAPGNERPAGRDKGASLGQEFSPGLDDSTTQATPASLAADGEDHAEIIEAAASEPKAGEPRAAGQTSFGGDVPGVAIQQSNRAPTAQDIARLRNQQQMAQMSGQLGAAQARLQSGQMTGARPQAIAYSEATASQAPAAQSAQDIGARASGLDLPSPMVGPLSMRIAAAKGDPSAEFEVAARYAEGKGVPQDFKQAMSWYQRSATQGFAQAQYRLGTLFERGLGTTVDLGRARIWYQRAAEQGNVKAMHNLAVLSAGRDAGSPDYTVAAQWFQQAAEYGLSDSQFNLAVLYDNGLGVTKDMKQAYKWYSLASLAGDKESVRRREVVRAKLAPGEVAEIDQITSKWVARSNDRMANDPRVAGEAWKLRQAPMATN